LGAERFDQLHAMLAHILVMVNSSKDSRRYETTEFLPPWHQHSRTQPKQTPEQMKTLMRAIGS
jgi:hypothetical protein